MVTPVFRIFDYPQALEFYVGWLGFRIDWQEVPARGPAYVQVARGELVLHLTGYDGPPCPGALVRVETQGLTAYYHKLVHKVHLSPDPVLGQAKWDRRVLEMEIVDPFDNRLVFCELAGRLA